MCVATSCRWEAIRLADQKLNAGGGALPAGLPLTLQVKVTRQHLHAVTVTSGYKPSSWSWFWEVTQDPRRFRSAGTNPPPSRRIVLLSMLLQCAHKLRAAADKFA